MLTIKKIKVPFKNKFLSATTNENTNAMPIVFIHGNSMSSKIWKRQFEGNFSNKYYLISFDLPGHGESDNLDSYTFSDLINSAPAVIKHFELKDYVIIGNSLGGDIILQLTQSLTNCIGVMLINTPPVSKPPSMEKALLPNPLIGMFFTKDYDSVNLDTFMEIFLYDVKNTPEFIKSDFQRTDGKSRQSLAEAVGALNYNDEVEALKNLHIPVAIVAGKNEKMVNNDYYKTLDIPKLWQKKIQVIEASAHCPQWEQSDTFNKLLDVFCNSSL
ncbi:MAG TPA: alpha/beta hydrolase [Bacteroidia bacterium]|jgi:pimeloyl-ACP methyl ester carboxylesterase|nr:alpha/beta hydrolase [Bacteroidia bacterium]